jgi:hypothetical protein
MPIEPLGQPYIHIYTRRMFPPLDMLKPVKRTS